ncbi:OB-fold nucleic acid binding domain-containing protein [Crocosphaera sp. UHCC 0190]|uniref:helix-hairpin-helix domain-containing protein n=1 Tax=Crocosphaera sp. UHCC 0190 TaxID=3110246 RepID=UPI002B20D94E|nr:OB-fold nucleic acid binding domain-containing protein [Crocosphaera sp. UHCC 0190]MEA5510785.1 OB-fold nucleic acid binding domain-containing protein [Crocosphaera sp. UHCC 0190]
MVKIIERQSLGMQTVYDIGVENDHNFLLGNGLVASNCFNKSHSTAYAYVTYQTAYLKANYPVEYMTALLTASSDNQDKIEKYRENCQKMKIDVQPPDINRSQKDFTPIGRKILFGLSAVRNLGEGAIENILKAREEAAGNFESLADFCSRVDLRAVNRRALETLIYCGAFDKLNANRKQLINDVELVISWAQKRAKDKESGQMNLLDLLGNDSSNNQETEHQFDQAPSSPSVADYSLQDKLKLEKEHLGFYVSEHPLKSISKAAHILSPINLSELGEQKSRKKVSAVVMINTVKQHITKKGDQMAFLTLEDVSGQVEGVVFSDAYQQIKDLLIEDTHLIIWGKVDHRDEKVQLLIEDAEVVESVKMVMINLSLKQAMDNSCNHSLKAILQEYSGDKNKAKTPVIATIGNGKNKQLIRFNQNYWVQNSETVINALNQANFQAYSAPLVPQ